MTQRLSEKKIRLIKRDACKGTHYDGNGKVYREWTTACIEDPLNKRKNFTSARCKPLYRELVPEGKLTREDRLMLELAAGKLADMILGKRRP